MSTKLNFDQSCVDALKDVRKDPPAAHWAALTYADGSDQNIVVLAKGNGNADELASHLADDKIIFALVRTTEQIDNSTTIKFAYIHFTGAHAKRMLVAKQSVHAGAAKEFFAPYHVSIAAEAKGDVSAAAVDEEIGLASGTRSKVLSQTTPTEKVLSSKQKDAGEHAASAPKPAAVTTTTTTTTAAPTTTSPPKAAAPKDGAVGGAARAPLGLACEDEDAIRHAIASVRSNSNGVNWALVTYVSGAKPDKLKLVGTGAGGVGELVGKLSNDNVYYALTRHVEKIDQTEAIKFAHVQYSAPQAPRMLKSRIGTHKGAVEALFRPYHVDLVTEDVGEVSEANLMDRITFASGTRSHVLQK